MALRRNSVVRRTQEPRTLSVVFQGVCIQNFEPTEDDELAMSVGHKIKVLKIDPSDPEWAESFNINTTRIGFIPLNHIKKIETSHAPDMGSKAMRRSVVRKSLMNFSSGTNNQKINFKKNPETIQNEIDKDLDPMNPYEVYESIYRYEPEQDDEMSFEKGQMIVAVGRSREDDGWLYGYKLGSSRNEKFAFCIEYVKPTGKTVPAQENTARKSVINFRMSKFNPQQQEIANQATVSKFVPPKLFVCSVEYIAEENDEMTMRPGQIIEAIGESQDEGWYVGINRSTIKSTGDAAIKHFPVTCCTPYKEQSAKPANSGSNLYSSASSPTRPISGETFNNALAKNSFNQDYNQPMGANSMISSPLGVSGGSGASVSKDQHSALEAKVNILEYNSEAMVKQMSEMNSKISNAVSANSMINSQFNSLNQEIDLIKTSQQQINSQMAMMESRISRLMNSFDSYGSGTSYGASNVSSKEILDLRKIIESVDGRLNNISEDFQATEARVAKLKNTVVNQNKNIASLYSTLSEYGDKIGSPMR